MRGRRRRRRRARSRCCSSCPVIFAALSYPLASVVAIGALDYIAYVAVGVAGDRPDPEYVGLLRALPRRARPCCAAGTPATRSRRREALARVSRADPLTGCLNRRGFEERFDAELSRALRNGRPFGLIMLDLDHFKEVNDTRGHAAGDELLRWAVDVMKDTVRPMDTIGRVGGDEFAVIVPGAGPDDSAAIARPPADRARRAGAGVGGRGRASRPTAPTATSCSARPTRSSTPASAAARDADEDDRQGAQLGDGAGARGRRPDGGPARALVEGRRVLRRASREQLGWPERDLELLQMAAILHDVGKVSIPDHILRKQQPLTERGVGGDQARTRCAAPRWSPASRGWRRSCRGSATRSSASTAAATRTASAARTIPPACRILHVADAFDAMHERAAVPRAACRDAEALRRAGAQRRHAVRPRSAWRRSTRYLEDADVTAERPAVAS